MTTERKFTNQEVNRLNQYLDPDFWGEWESLDSLGRMQLSKKVAMDRVLWRIDTHLSALSPYGTDYVEKIRQDLIEGFDLLLVKKQSPSANQFYQLMELYEAAIDTSDLQLQEAEAIPVVSLLLGAAAFKPMALAAKASKVHKALFILDRLVTQAMGLKIEAQIQQALGLVSGTIGLMVPGLSLMTKGALTVADLVLDNELGPNKSAVKDAAGNTAKILNLTMDAIGDIKRFAASTHKIASKTGKVLTVTGFYFDWDEVRQADELLKAVQAALKEAKKLYDDLVKDLDKESKRLETLEREFSTRLQPLKQKIWEQRGLRDELIRDLGYPITTPFRWQMEPQRQAS